MPADAIGWLAAGLTFLTFSMRDMLALRIVGIAANLAFVSYGMVEDIYPIVALHALLLPCNVYRLCEIVRGKRLASQRAAKAIGSARARV